MAAREVRCSVEVWKCDFLPWKASLLSLLIEWMDAVDQVQRKQAKSKGIDDKFEVTIASKL